MLTEHVAMLKEYNQEIKKEPKPELDEWDYDAIQHTLDA
ncbi:YolD-like family protein, partial [Psychrobacillus psychrotolerans]